MSSEIKTAVPKLRFPEFRDAEEWNEQELRPFLHLYSERVSSDTRLGIYSSSREGLLPQDEYYGGNKLQNGGEYGVVPDGFFVYRHMSDDTTFKFNINRTGAPIAVSKEYPVFRAIGIEPSFLRYLLNESATFKSFAAMQRKGGTRTRLYFETLCSWNAPLPKSEEQQKIANCLTSLDELIETEGQKLEALRDHKKGLMQNLFPAEGQTLPKFRFPEFRDVQEWVRKPLEKVAQYENGKAYEPHIVEEGRFIVANSRFISTEGGVRKYTNESFCIAGAGDVLMVLSDLPNGRALAKCFFVGADDRYAVNQRVCRLEAHSIYDRFLFYALNRHPELLSYDDKINQTHLSKAAVLKCSIGVPDIKEQQKIANCLSYLDELISAQSQKIVALREHKKGLLQQLFPSAEEVA